MSSTVDANILVYAADSTSPYHGRARQALADLFDGPGLVHLFWPTVVAFLRLSTSRALSEDPLGVDEALDAIAGLLDRDNVTVSGEPEAFWPALRQTVGEVAARGNLVSDAHLVALMRTVGVRTILTHDRDFRKFDWIQVEDPFADPT